MDVGFYVPSFDLSPASWVSGWGNTTAMMVTKVEACFDVGVVVHRD